MKIDKKIIKELNDYLKEFNLTEIEITDKDTKIKVSKHNVSIGSQSPAISAATTSTDISQAQTKNLNSGKEVTSPIIEIHLSNIYKREEFRHKSLISGVVTGGIFELGDVNY